MDKSYLIKGLKRILKLDLVSGSAAERAITFGYSGILLISIIAIYMTANHVAQWFLYNSDSLWMEDYLHDWLIRGVDMRTWMTPGAPNFFPGMLIYGLFRYATGSVYWGFIGYGFVMIIFYVGMIYCLLSLISEISRVHKLWLSMLCTSVLLLATILLGSQFNYLRMPDFWQLFEPTGHGEAIANSLFAIYLILRWIRDPDRGYVWLLLLLLLSVTASLSDRLYAVWFEYPTLGAAVILLLLRRISWRPLVRLVSVLLISDVIGREIFVWIVPVQQVPYKLSFNEGLQLSFRFYLVLFNGGWYHPFVLFSYVCLVGITIRVLFFAWKARSGQVLVSQETTKLFLLPYATLVLPSSFFAMSLINRPETQYITGGDLVAISLWVFLLTMSSFGLRLWMKGWFHTVIITIQVGYICLRVISSPASWSSILTIPNPYSELVTCLDSHVKDFKGGAGLADYWQARRINLYSQRGLRVDQALGEDLTIFQWVSNREMLDDRKHTFVLTDTPTNLFEIREEDVIRLHGQPDARFICAGYPVLVYYDSLDVPATQNGPWPLPGAIIKSP